MPSTEDCSVDLTPTRAACLNRAEPFGRWRVSERAFDRWRADQNRPAWIELNGRARYRLEDVLAFERAPLLRP